MGPLPVDPVQKKPTSERAPILSAVPLVVQEEPKKEKPKSVTGFMENALDDAWDLAKGLYEIIPSTVKSYQQNVPYILKNLDALSPGMLFRYESEGGSKDQIIKGEFKGAIPETMKGLLEAGKQPYKEHGAAMPYYKPFTFGADLATALTLGGGSIKNAGKVAKAAGAGERAERLIQVGTFLEELPAEAARRGIDLTVKTATGGKWDLAKRRDFLQDVKGPEQGRRIQKIEGDINNVVKKLDALNPQEFEEFHKARVFGEAQGYGKPFETLPPKVQEALKSLDELVNKADPNMVDHGITEFYKSRGLLNAETAENTLAKKFSLEAFGDVSDANVAKARQLIKETREAGKRPPIYGQNVFVDEVGKARSADTLLDDMITGGKKMREGKVSPLEEMKGAKGYTRDPRIYVREMIKNFRNTEAKMRTSERLLESPELIKGGGQALDVGKFREALPEGVHRKYYEDKIRAQALKSITDPTIQRLLKWEYLKNNSALVRIYDRMHALFAKSATMFNPRWVTGNVVGDAVLGMIAGSDWVEGVRNLKRGNMPPQIAAKNVTLATQDITAPRGKLSSAVHYLPERAADVAGYVDRATRAGIVTREAGRRYKEAALSFESSAASFQDVLRSTERFADVQVQMRLLAERVQRTSAHVVSRDRQIVALMQKERKLEAARQSIAHAADIGTPQEAAILKKIDQLEAQKAEILQKREGLSESSRTTKGQIRKLAKESPEAVVNRLAKAMRRENAAATSFYRDLLTDIRKRGGIRSDNLPGSRDFIPKGLLGKGVSYDELAQELADRGIISAPTFDDLADALQAASAAVRQPMKLDKMVLRAQAKRALAEQGTAAANDLVRITNEQASLRRQLSMSKRSERMSRERVSELAGRMQAKATALGDEAAAVRQRIVNLTTERDYIVRDIVDDLAKSGELEKLVPGLKEQVAIVRPAVERANAFVGDYLAMDGFEQGVLRRLIPFYSWTKAMTMLAFRLPFIAPVKSFAWNRFSDLLATMTDDPQIKEEVKGRVPVTALKDGRTVWAKLTTYSPFESLKTSRYAGIPVPSMLNIVERNPFIALFFELGGGKTIWDVSSIPYGEQMVSIGDGTVLRVKPNGKIEREIPQTPLVAGIMDKFPSVQLAKQALMPYWTNKYNWAGMPEPVLNADGSYRYPRELWDRLGAAVGINTMTRSREDVIRSRKLKAIKNVREMQAMYKRTKDPEEREFIMDAMKDYIKQEVHGERR